MNTSSIPRARWDKSPKRHRRIVPHGIAIRRLLSRACLRQVFDESHDGGHVRANSHFSADIGLFGEMNGFIHVPRIGFIAVSDAGELNVPDLPGRNFEIVFLVFTELKRIASQDKSTGETYARPITVINTDSNCRRPIKDLPVPLG